MRTGIHTARPVIPQEFLQAKHKRPRPCIVIRQKTGNAPFSVFFRRIGSPTLKSGEKRTTFKSPEMPNDIAQQDANLPFLSPAPVPERQQPQKRAVLPGLPQPRSSPSTLPAGDRPRTQRHSVQRPPPKTLRIPPQPAPGPRSDTPRPLSPAENPARRPRNLPPKTPHAPMIPPLLTETSAGTPQSSRRNRSSAPSREGPRRSPPQVPPPTSGRQKARPRATGTRPGHKRDTR